MKKTVFAALLAFSCFHFSVAQVSISSVNYNAVSLNETNLLQAIVMNGGNTLTATASISCRNASGETIIEALTKPFALKQGMNSISGITVGFSRFGYGHSNQALYLKNNGMLPPGNFVYCLKINVISNGEEGDLFCEDFASATDDFLSLVVPYDGDTIDTRYPILTWTHTQPFNALAQNEYYKITVSEIKQGQSPEQAIISNPCVFWKSFLNTHSVPYPQDAQLLEDGKSYAWQIQKVSNNIIVNKSDVWRFTMTKSDTKKPLKYIFIDKEKNHGVYQMTDDRLYFSFTERYTAGDLQYEITNEKNEKQVLKIRHDASQQSPELKTNGVNLYEMDLSGFLLQEGHYTLMVMNGKGEKFYLKFYVEK